MKYFFLFVSIFFLNTVQSQQNHFVFIQSETREPFNVTINKKVYSSTATGYVIVPKLISGQYNLTIAFGGNTTPNQDFAITLNQDDAGYSLKDFPGKGWGLFNLQSFSVAMSQQAVLSTSTQMSPFQSVGTNANNKAEPAINIFQPDVNQPVVTNSATKTQPSNPAKPALVVPVTEKPEVPGEIPISTAPAPAANFVTTPADNPGPVTTQFKTPPNSNTAPPLQQPPQTELVVAQTAAEPFIVSNPSHSSTVANALKNVNKISELKGSEAYYITYVDYTTTAPDTINLLIPTSPTEALVAIAKPANEPKFLELSPTVTAEKAVVAVQSDLGSASQAPPVTNTNLPQPAPVNVLANQNLASVALPVTNTAPQPAAPVSATATSTTNKCSTMATYNDFLQLRKRMAAAADDDGMIAEARNTFKTMCFTTNQVKNLAYLFLTDDGKYRFFDSSYSYIVDREAFSTLSQLISELYYLNRFKAMLINQ